MTLCKLLRMTSVEFDERLKAYNALVRWFGGMDIRFLPAAPAIDASCEPVDSDSP